MKSPQKADARSDSGGCLQQRAGPGDVRAGRQAVRPSRYRLQQRRASSRSTNCFMKSATRNSSTCIQVNLQRRFLRDQVRDSRICSKAGGGAIINTASVGGLKSLPEAGLHRVEGRGHRDNPGGRDAIRPSPHPHQLHLPRHHLHRDEPRHASADVRQGTGPQDQGRISALGRIGMPEDMARVALFLASDDAAFVTAAPFIVDGGFTTA